MKKIKILHGFLKVCNIMFVFGMINYLRMPFFKLPWETTKILKDFMGPSLVDFYRNMLFGCIFVIGLILIQKSLYYIIKTGYFNQKSALLLKKAGFVFIITSVIDIIRFAFNTSAFYPKFNTIAVEIFILIVGVGILIFSDIMKKGNDLQEENDLTI